MNPQEFEKNVQTMSAIAQLMKMQDFSGTLVQLHTYFAELLEQEENELKAGEIVKFLIDLSEYILSWKEKHKLDKRFLHLCSKIIEDRVPDQDAHDLDQEQVQNFFAKALELEPEIAQQLTGQTQGKEQGLGEQ